MDAGREEEEGGSDGKKDTYSADNLEGLKVRFLRRTSPIL